MALIHKISLLALSLVATATGSAVIGYANRSVEVVASEEEEEIEKVEVKEEPSEKPKKKADCNQASVWWWMQKGAKG